MDCTQYCILMFQSTDNKAYNQTFSSSTLFVCFSCLPCRISAASVSTLHIRRPSQKAGRLRDFGGKGRAESGARERGAGWGSLHVSGEGVRCASGGHCAQLAEAFSTCRVSNGWPAGRLAGWPGGGESWMLKIVTIRVGRHPSRIETAELVFADLKHERKGLRRTRGGRGTLADQLRERAWGGVSGLL